MRRMWFGLEMVVTGIPPLAPGSSTPQTQQIIEFISNLQNTVLVKINVDITLFYCLIK